MKLRNVFFGVFFLGGGGGVCDGLGWLACERWWLSGGVIAFVVTRDHG